MGGLLILFPGQGSQSAGMAEYLWDYPVARETFAEAGGHTGLGHRRAMPSRNHGGADPHRPDASRHPHLQCRHVEGLGGRRCVCLRWPPDIPWVSTRLWSPPAT